MRKVKPYKWHSEMKKSEDEGVLPNISLPLSAIPEAKKWEVGKTYLVTLQVEMTRLSIGGGGMDMGPSSSDGSVGFEVYGVEAGKEVKGKVERYQDDKEEK